MKLGIIPFLVMLVVLGASCSKDQQSEVDNRSSMEKKSSVIFVGTYTKKEGHVDGKSPGIHVLEIDEKGGALSEVGVSKGAINPSFLVISPDQKYLYAVNETGPDVDTTGGSISAFAIESGGKGLRFLNKQSSHSFAPCYVSMDNAGRYVFAANYVGGKVLMLPVNNDGSLEPASDVVTLSGKGPHPRQESSHPHSIVLSPDNRYAFVSDLGTDNIWKFRIDYKNGKLLQEEDMVKVAPGAGPRHLVFHPNGKWAFVINELANTVTVFGYRASTGSLITIQSLSTLPDGFSGESYCADIHVSPNGRYLYGSNRGHNTIVCYSINSANGRLTMLGHESTRGDFPRNFMIGNQGKYLHVANQNSDNVVTFRIGSDGRLSHVGELSVPTPVCLKSTK